MNSRITEFCRGTGTDAAGRLRRTILAWPDDQLERVHDYIQWLFPLPERSGANPSAPLLDQETIARFRGSRELQDALRESFLRMLRFYGLELQTAGELRVAEAPSFAQRANVWLQAGNHNHLRITRILRCLTLLGLEAEAQAFLAWLSRTYQAERAKSWPAIPEATFEYWSWAVDSGRSESDQ